MADSVSVHHVVTEADTAVAMGSGDVPVLATPRLIAWLEAATVQSAASLLDAGQTTVGTSIRVDHRRATALDAGVTAEAATPARSEGRRLTFAVRVVDDEGEVVASGEIDRVIVDRERFLASVTTAD
ncbi:thioesterase family protein [Humibacter sp.]|uniref:thioesterase family protein n=1 Tax=Humibacter sp. TaxID=1940291 RepID=UPI003F80024C